MIFLIEYDRKQGQLVTFESFGDSDRKKAEEARLQLELDLNLKTMRLYFSKPQLRRPCGERTVVTLKIWLNSLPLRLDDESIDPLNHLPNPC